MRTCAAEGRLCQYRSCHGRLFDKSVNMLDSHDLLADDAARWARLTEKHRACLDLILDHRTSKQIARILGIAKPTVDQRRSEGHKSEVQSLMPISYAVYSL